MDMDNRNGTGKKSSNNINNANASQSSRIGRANKSGWDGASKSKIDKANKDGVCGTNIEVSKKPGIKAIIITDNSPDSGNNITN